MVQMTFGKVFANSTIAQRIKATWSGKPYITTAEFCSMKGYVYETGAVLGQLYSDNIEDLARLFSQEGSEIQAVEYLKDLARKNAEEYRQVYGQDIYSILIFAMALAYKQAGILLPVGQQIEFSEKQTKKSLKSIKKAAHEKVIGNERLNSCATFLEMTFAQGVGFGSCWPDWTEQLYRDSYEKIDMETSQEASLYGVNLSTTPTVLTLEDREDELLDALSEFTKQYRLDLVYLVELV